MKTTKQRWFSMVAMAILCAATGRGTLAADAVGRVVSAGDFAGHLLRNHPYLFDERQRQELDEINRRLREAEQAAQKSQTPDARNAATTQLAAAGGDLIRTLEGCGQLVRVSLSDGGVSLSPAGPFALPGDVGGLLLRIDAGGDPVRLSVVEIDFSELGGEAHQAPVEVAPVGVTWAVVTLRKVPAARTSFVLSFRCEGRPPVGVPVDFKAPPTGRLRVKVLSDDTGLPTPAMIRLVWKTDGLDRPPSNAIDFGPQFEMQGNASGRRISNGPNGPGEAYWCVPGPFEMSLPAGDWEIRVRRGVEHIPLTDTFNVPPGQRVDRTYTCRRWIDMRHLGWYSGDDHVHGRIMSDADAERLMAWIRAEDIHVANVVKMGDIYRTWFEQRGWGREYRVIDGDYVLSPGQECPRTHDQIGHTLAMNTRSMVRDTDRYYLYDWVFDAVRGQGGLAGYAHVCSGMFHVHRDMSINIPKGKIDFVELMQFGRLGTELYYDFLNTGFKVTASAGSDVPWGGTVGEVRLYAYIGGQPFSADAWFEAVRRGRTFVTNGPMVDLLVENAMPGDEITVRENRRLRVRARAWGRAECSPVSRLEIVRHGEVVASRSADDSVAEDGGDLRINAELEAGHGFWVAARAIGKDGTAAHTTPVYVVREGLRFWKYESVSGLIAQRMASLKEVEDLIGQCRAVVARGEAGPDRAVSQLAAQGDELMKRVEAARDLYRHLLEVAGKEGAVRAGGR